MALSFDLFKVVDVKNPSKHCTEVFFSDGNQNDLKITSLVIFEQQVKYIITEEYESHKRVKIYIIDDDSDPIVIDFHPDEYELYEAFFLALYNKNI
ncbi:MAG: hypothetical protein NTY80_01330 [candidate division SR1 bacterium]|nr:hypothetical protein [candidate division SR1 bacterium]